MGSRQTLSAEVTGSLERTRCAVADARALTFIGIAGPREGEAGFRVSWRPPRGCRRAESDTSRCIRSLARHPCREIPTRIAASAPMVRVPRPWSRKDTRRAPPFDPLRSCASAGNVVRVEGSRPTKRMRASTLDAGAGGRACPRRRHAPPAPRTRGFPRGERRDSTPPPHRSPRRHAVWPAIPITAVVLEKTHAKTVGTGGANEGRRWRTGRVRPPEVVRLSGEFRRRSDSARTDGLILRDGIRTRSARVERRDGRVRGARTRHANETIDGVGGVGGGRRVAPNERDDARASRRRRGVRRSASTGSTREETSRVAPTRRATPRRRSRAQPVPP